MRKIILAATAIIITTCTYAQTDSTNRKNFPPDMGKTPNDQMDKYNTPDRDSIKDSEMNNDIDKDKNVLLLQDTIVNKKSMKNHPDGYMMVDGKLMEVKNGNMTLLKKDIILGNETVVMSNGNYMIKGGKKIMLKEGEHLDMTGKLIPMKK
jgi:hypothetical protein